MELYERIKALRRDQCLSQTAFGERLGVSRSVINNLERNVLTKNRNIKSLVKLMSYEFSVSEDWLWHGESLVPLYLPSKIECFDLLRSRGAAEWEAKFISTYLKFDARQRDSILQGLEDIIEFANRVIERANKDLD